MMRVLLAVALMAASGAVNAHSAMVRAEPGPRSTVIADGRPVTLTLWFNERVEAKWSAVSLERAGGQPVDGVGKPGGVDGEPKALRVTLPPLEPGRYTVRYRVLSVDGHVVKWGYEFTVADPVGER